MVLFTTIMFLFTVQRQFRESPETVWRQSRDSPKTVQRQSTHSPETVQTQSRHSPETVPRQPRDSPETVQSQSRDSPETVQRHLRGSFSTQIFYTTFHTIFHKSFPHFFSTQLLKKNFQTNFQPICQSLLSINFTTQFFNAISHHKILPISSTNFPSIFAPQFVYQIVHSFYQFCFFTTCLHQPFLKLKNTYIYKPLHIRFPYFFNHLNTLKKNSDNLFYCMLDT